MIHNQLAPEEETKQTNAIFEEEVASIGLVSQVILYNDEWHTFEEVIYQIIKALGCAFSRAEAITLEVHSRGKAIVYTGSMQQCLRVSSVLEEILLHTQIVT